MTYWYILNFGAPVTFLETAKLGGVYKFRVLIDTEEY